MPFNPPENTGSIVFRQASTPKEMANAFRLAADIIDMLVSDEWDVDNYTSIRAGLNHDNLEQLRVIMPIVGAMSLKAEEEDEIGETLWAGQQNAIESYFGFPEADLFIDPAMGFQQWCKSGLNPREFLKKSMMKEGETDDTRSVSGDKV